MATFRYRPLLRSKAGEANALKNLDANTKQRMAPIVHLVHKPPATFVTEVSQSWKGHQLALDGTFHVDQINSTTQHTQTFDKLGKAGVQIIPSVEYGAIDPYRLAASKLVGKFANGLVVKVPLNQLAGVATWVASQGWKQADIDLVVNLNEIAGFDPALLHPMVSSVLNSAIGTSSPWRSVTLAASSAPKDHGGLPVGKTLVPRRCWQLWSAVHGAVPWKLDFGDYGIGTPELADPPGLAMTRATVSVRYTIDDYWIVLKGTPTSGKTGQPMETQYRRHAKALTAEPAFNALTICWGDDRITQIANGAPGAGNRTTWVGISANRHFSLVGDRLP